MVSSEEGFEDSCGKLISDCVYYKGVYLYINKHLDGGKKMCEVKNCSRFSVIVVKAYVVLLCGK